MNMYSTTKQAQNYKINQIKRKASMNMYTTSLSTKRTGSTEYVQHKNKTNSINYIIKNEQEALNMFSTRTKQIVLIT